MNIVHFLFSIPPIIGLAISAVFIFKAWRLHVKHRRFMKADDDCRMAIQMMERSTTDEQFNIRRQRVLECLEMMEKIHNENRK